MAKMQVIAKEFVPLVEAIRKKNLEAVYKNIELLCRKDIFKLWKPNNLFETIIQTFKEKDKNILVEGILNALGYPPEKYNSLGSSGYSLLHKAVILKDSEFVQFLISKKVDVNLKCGLKTEATPLHYAVRIESLGMLKTLINNGADVTIEDADKNTPFHIAAKYTLHSLKTLLSLKQDQVNIRNSKGDTPLTIAAQENKIEQLRVLIDAGADVNAMSSDGRTPLDLAQDFRIRRILCNAGAKTSEEIKAARFAFSVAMNELPVTSDGAFVMPITKALAARYAYSVAPSSFPTSVAMNELPVTSDGAVIMPITEAPAASFVSSVASSRFTPTFGRAPTPPVPTLVSASETTSMSMGDIEVWENDGIVILQSNVPITEELLRKRKAESNINPPSKKR